jgi:hypothetical protein
MPQERLPMRKVRDVLRLSADGLSKRKIAASLGLSATAVGDCIRRARVVGVAWPLAAELTDAALERLLYPPATVAKQRPQPDWAAIHLELKRPGVTLQLLWEEYRAVHPDAHAYSRYVAARFMLSGRVLWRAAWTSRHFSRNIIRSLVANLCSREVRHGSNDLSQPVDRT